MLLCAQDVAIIKQLMLRNTVLISWQDGDLSSKAAHKLENKLKYATNVSLGNELWATDYSRSQIRLKCNKTYASLGKIIPGLSWFMCYAPWKTRLLNACNSPTPTLLWHVIEFWAHFHFRFQHNADLRGPTDKCPEQRNWLINCQRVKLQSYNAWHVFFSAFVKAKPNYSDYCNRPPRARAKASAASDMNTNWLVHNNR